MIKNIISGIIFGIANIIPGISGGTVLVFLGLFNKTIECIANIFKRGPLSNKVTDILFLLQMGIGILIGLVSFAKVISYLLNYYPVQTMYWFIGLIVFSIPNVFRRELQGIKLSNIHFVMGMVIIVCLMFLNPTKTELVIKDFPPITILYLSQLILLGMITAMITIIPGVSGSLFLLIIGKYYLIQSYVASSTTLQVDILVPIFFFGFGALIGLGIGARIINYFLINYQKATISFILGLVIMSAVVLIPINVTYNLSLILSSLISFLLGGVIIGGFEWLQVKRNP
ncbi:MAG: DUF368 domain-containing protein [Bacilli bacterium]|jgi:putative membrane protein